MKFLLHLSLSILFLCFTFQLKAQFTVDYEVSDKMKSTRYTNLNSGVTSLDDEKILLVKNTPKLLKVGQKWMVLDQNMDILSQVESRERLIEELVKTTTGIWAIYRKKEDRKNPVIYAAQIDEETFKLKNEMVMLKAANDGKFPYTELKYITSEDETKFMILAEYRVKKKENQKYAIGVFNQDMQKGYGRVYTLNEQSRDFDFGDAFLGNDGAAYFVGKKLTEKKIFSHQYDEVVIHRIFNKDEIKKYSLDLRDDELYIDDLTLVNPNNRKGIGVLAFQESRASIENVVLIDLDQNMKEITKKVSPLEFENFILDGDDKKKDKAKKKKNKAKEQQLLEIRQVTLTPDNSRIVIAEQYTLIIHTYHNPQTGASSTSYSYFFGDVVAMKFNSDNELLWAKKIPKHQRGAHPGPLGVSIKATENAHYIIFNDDKRNETKDRDKLYKYANDYKKGICKAVRLDNETGESLEKIVFYLKEEGMYVEPKNYFEMADGSLISLGFKGKDRTVLKMYFKE